MNIKLKLKKIIEKKLNEIAEQNKNLKIKKIMKKQSLETKLFFDYSATVDGKKFEGSEEKACKLN